MSITHLKGIDTVMKNLNKEISKITLRTESGLVSAALEIMSDASKDCPVVTGNLKNSRYVVARTGIKRGAQGKFKGEKAEALAANHSAKLAENQAQVRSAKFIQVNIGFTAAYAPFVHENPNVGKVEKRFKMNNLGQWKSEKPEKGSRKKYSTVGQWKFLEKALSNTKKILWIIAEKARIR